MVIAIAFQIHTFDQSGWTTDPLLFEAPFIAWSQSEMNYSLISATIPSFQSFLKNMNTQFGGIGPNEKSAYANNSATDSRIRKGSAATFEMGKVRSVNRKSTIPEIDESNDFGAVGSRRGSAGIAEGRPSAGTAGGLDTVNEEVASLHSNESGRMMIRKDVTWTVGHEQP